MFVGWKDTFILHTPGGGGWGLPKESHLKPNGDLQYAAESGVEEAGPSPVKKSRREPKIEPEAIPSPKTKKNAKTAEETSPSQEAAERRRSLRKRSWRVSTYEIVMQFYSIFSLGDGKPKSSVIPMLIYNKYCLSLNCAWLAREDKDPTN